MKRGMIRIMVCFFLELLFLTACERGINQTDVYSSTRENELTYNDDRQTRAEPYPTVKIPTKPDDPYAKIIRDLYEEYAQYPDAETILAREKYALFDIDGDGKDELLLNGRYEQWGGESFGWDRSEMVSVLKTIYTNRNGKAIDVTQPILGFWEFLSPVMGGRDILSNGVIRCYGGSPDYTSYGYYRFLNGNLEFLGIVFKYETSGYWHKYLQDGEEQYVEISEEEFNHMRAEIEGDAQVVEIDWKPLESYGRE